MHFGRLAAPGGFQKTVVIKVPHTALAHDADFRAMFLDEARIASCIRSEHVVQTLDVLEVNDAIFQIMEYANGPSLSTLLKLVRARSEELPISIVLAIVVDALEGLHAAHEATDGRGAPLSIVHRDVSPQNVIVVDTGVAKVLDFGVASAAGKLHLTQPGDVKGKISYMAPEQIEARPVDRRADVYAAGVVLFEALTGRRPFVADELSAVALMHVLEAPPDPTLYRAEIPAALARVIARALEKQPRARYATARAMADALLALPTPRATAHEVADWLRDAAGSWLRERAELLSTLADAEEWTGEVAGTVTAPTEGPKPRRRAVTWVASAGLVGVALAAGAFGLSRASRSQVAVAAPPTSAHAAPAASAAPEARASAAPEARESASSAPSAAAAVAPVETVKRVAPVPHPTARAPAPEAGVAALPPCCAGDLRLRMTGCADNCPHEATNP